MLTWRVFAETVTYGIHELHGMFMYLIKEQAVVHLELIDVHLVITIWLHYVPD